LSPGEWNTEDVIILQDFHKKHGGLKKGAIERCLGLVEPPRRTRRGILSALQSYYQAFFEEEEKRIEPA
jgi:hypothetical protein